MLGVRPPAVAGLFYPADPGLLRSEIKNLFRAVEDETDATVPKALIVPHAGYIYSGPVAAAAYAQLLKARNAINHVVLLGPAHRFGFAGFSASRASAFATPLGEVPVNQRALAAIASLPGFCFEERAHLQEHSLEVQLPFLQTVLADFSLTPLVIGDTDAEQVGRLLEMLWGGEETLIVISSDLSHFLDYEAACQRDRETSRAIIDLRYQDLSYGDACGRNPVSGLLWLAQRLGLHGRIIDVRNSGDTAGSREQVVGYGAYGFG